MKPLQSHLQQQLQTRKLFIPYIMAGDGGLDTLYHKIRYLEQRGASAIEIGIPFSDPVADGPTIQEAGQRALDNGTTLSSVLTELAKIKEKVQVPLIIMSYLNPILQYRIEQFVADAQRAGIQGLIIPDVPVEEQALIKEYTDASSISYIQLISLMSTVERTEKIIAQAEGFLYAVTMNGTTGKELQLNETSVQYLNNLRQKSKVPVIAGFGISTKQHIEEVTKYTDGAIVGSVIVKAFHENNLAIIEALQTGNVHA